MGSRGRAGTDHGWTAYSATDCGSDSYRTTPRPVSRPPGHWTGRRTCAHHGRHTSRSAGTTSTGGNPHPRPDGRPEDSRWGEGRDGRVSARPTGGTTGVTLCFSGSPDRPSTTWPRRASRPVSGLKTGDGRPPDPSAVWVRGNTSYRDRPSPEPQGGSRSAHSFRAGTGSTFGRGVSSPRRPGSSWSSSCSSSRTGSDCASSRPGSGSSPSGPDSVVAVTGTWYYRDRGTRRLAGASSDPEASTEVAGADGLGAGGWTAWMGVTGAGSRFGPSAGSADREGSGRTASDTGSRSRAGVGGGSSTATVRDRRVHPVGPTPLPRCPGTRWRNEPPDSPKGKEPKLPSGPPHPCTGVWESR